MNRLNTFLAAMLFTGAAQAMEIRQFDKMADDDKAEFIAELVQGAEKVLTDEGKPDLAAKVSHLFTTNPPDGDISIGMSQFYLTLALARVADAERAAKDPNAHRLEVEDAMLVMFKKNDIPLSPDFIRDFRTVASGFKPKFPPKKQ
jgi:hypothetical protein